MGGCCSIDAKFATGRQIDDDMEVRDYDSDEEEETRVGDGGAIVRLKGSSWCTSMYTRQGKKGINQDAMTVWENFSGEKNVLFCGVFDGHGPSGHKVARHVRDLLPTKLSSAIKQSLNGNKHNDTASAIGENCGNSIAGGKQSDNEDSSRFPLSSWESNLIKSFKELDEELGFEESIDSFCSGTTASTIIKKGEHLIIANLGDSRAVLCTRGSQNQLLAVQLTVDLKPSVAGEAERIKDCGGRVFALEEEPNVFRVWMPEDDCPGLAMARAFGDFCLKDYGLISTPEVYYRKLTSYDEFIVLATDGVWDVLTNNEVIAIVASVKNRSMAAKVLVYYAVRAWKSKYPGSKVDDCAAICLFLKKQPLLVKSMSDPSQDVIHRDLSGSHSVRSKKSDGGETVINCQITMDPKALGELKRKHSFTKPTRFRTLSRRKTAKNYEGGRA